MRIPKTTPRNERSTNFSLFFLKPFALRCFPSLLVVCECLERTENVCKPVWGEFLYDLGVLTSENWLRRDWEGSCEFLEKKKFMITFSSACLSKFEKAHDPLHVFTGKYSSCEGCKCKWSKKHSQVHKKLAPGPHRNSDISLTGQNSNKPFICPTTQMNKKQCQTWRVSIATLLGPKSQCFTRNRMVFPVLLWTTTVRFRVQLCEHSHWPQCVDHGLLRGVPRPVCEWGLKLEMIDLLLPDEKYFFCIVSFW